MQAAPVSRRDRGSPRRAGDAAALLIVIVLLPSIRNKREAVFVEEA